MKWYPSSSDCVFTNTGGVQYEELTCVYPFIAKTYFPIEINFDPVPMRDWMQDHPIVPIVAVSLYAFLITWGKRYFSTRPALDWRRTMALWNLGLSLFSAIGVLRVAPKLLHNLRYYSLTENFCLDPESHYGSGSTGLWVQLFVLSKFPELIDTFFIVIHKKPLILLHWYHHISVLLYCWHAYVTSAPTGIIFCVMNYAVHSLMYFYYFLMAMKVKPKAFRAVYITVAQISQMVVGVAVTAFGCYLLYTNVSDGSGVKCYLSGVNISAALVMYGSYLCLFLEFFWKKYTGSGGAKPTKKTKTS